MATTRDKISLNLSKIASFPNGSTQGGTLEINCDEKNLFTVCATKMIDGTDTTWQIKNRSAESIMIRNQMETRKMIRMPGSKIQILGALIDNYFSVPFQKHYLIKVLGKLPKMELRNAIRVSSMEVVLKNSKGSAPGLNRFLQSLNKEGFCCINLIFEKMPNPGFFKQDGLIGVLPSRVKIYMPKFDLAIVKQLKVEDLYADFEDGVTSSEQLKEMAEYLIHRNDCYRLAISVADEYGSDAIQEICENDGWEFIPNTEKLVAIFRHSAKNMIITLDAEYRTLVMEIVGNEDPRCAIRDTIQNVKGINDGICAKPYGERKEMEKQYIWEPRLPYHLSEMEVDFEKCVVVCDKYEMKLADKDETVSKFASIVSNPKTIIEKLKIIGYHEVLKEKNMRINVVKLTLIYDQNYPSGLDNLFSRLVELYVYSEGILSENSTLKENAQRLFLLQADGSSVQLK